MTNKNSTDFDVVWRAEHSDPGTPWHLCDIGLSFNGASSALIKRMMRHSEYQAEMFLEELLDGKASPEEPRLLHSPETLWDRPYHCAGLWFCIVQEGSTPPEPEPYEAAACTCTHE